MVTREREFETRAIATEEKANGAKGASRSGLVGEFVSRKVSPSKFWQCLLQNAQLPGVPAPFLIGQEGKRPIFILQLTPRPRPDSINCATTTQILIPIMNSTVAIEVSCATHETPPNS